MIWCRFQKGNSISYGIVEGDTVTAVEGDPFTEHRVTANTFPLTDVKLLVPVLPGTFYAIGSNYRNHVEGRAKVKGTAPKFYETPRVGYRANSALIATGETIVKPSDAGPHFEYEAELVAVVGKTVRNVTPAEATAAHLRLDHRQRRDRARLAEGRSHQSARQEFRHVQAHGSLDRDRASIPRAMTTNVRRNGKTLHSFATGNMLFGPGEVISADLQIQHPVARRRGLARHRRSAARASIPATSWRSRSPASGR